MSVKNRVEPLNQTHLDNRNAVNAPEPVARSQTVGSRVLSLGVSSTDSSNQIRTSKYTLLTWAPKSLLWQFRRVANIYFLIISILTAMPFSPKSPYSMIGTFSFVLVFTMLKEAYEDYFRHQQDKQVNSRPVRALCDSSFVSIPCKDLSVGQIVKIQNDEFIPADILLLASSHTKGLAFVNTINLDGETNLKEKLSPETTLGVVTTEALSKIQGTVESEEPGPNMHSWMCSLKIANEKPSALGIKQLLIRGSILKNTDFVFGVVVYTGHDTKIMLNSKAVPSKVSKILRLMNKVLYSVFGFQLLICLTFAGFSVHWTASEGSLHTYLDLSDRELAAGYFIQTLTYWVAYSHLIPISLYVALEIVKLGQAYLISQDLDMYYAPTDTPANSRTSDLVEELGQVEFVFSDKTGTLTCNEMKFRKFAIGSEIYGHLTDGPGFGGDTRPIECLHNTSHPNFRDFDKFFSALAVCHSAFPHKEDLKIVYQAPSPDEIALVEAASSVGYTFTERTDSMIGLESESGLLEWWKVLAEFPFTSERKRMSVIVQHPRTKHMLLIVKGADSVMFDKVKDSLTEPTQIVHKFACEGLRTLVIAQKQLPPSEFKDWYTSYEQLELSLDKNKEEAIWQHLDTIENNLDLLGITAIEDRLQEKVPDTIQLLLSAQIRVWVLTGDKLETAIEIGKTCNLLTPDQTVINLSGNDQTSVGRTLETLDQQFHLQTSSFPQLDRAKAVLDAKIGLVVDGPTLIWIMQSPLLKNIFFKLGYLATSCICCRVTPLQKLQVVALAKEHGPWITLSIGDGANDVSMIQEAHIGVGIVGKEGTQAVQSSDFALAQFSHLAPLLLAHGRWCYKRISAFICYYFYKNILLVLTELFFAFFNGFSGQIFYLDWLPMLYNSFWTSWPCMIAYVFDQDVDKEYSMSFPLLYGAGQKDAYFGFKVFWGWLSLAMWHSVVCYWLSVLVYSSGPVDSSGVDTGLWWVSSFVFSLVVNLITLKLFIETGVFCLVFYYVSVIVLSTESFSELFQPEAAWLFFNLLGTSKAMIGLFLVPIVASLPDLFRKSMKQLIAPTPVQELAKRIKLGLVNRN